MILSMFRFWKCPSSRGPAGDLVVGQGGPYASASAAHDVAAIPHDLETSIGGDAAVAAEYTSVDLEAGTDGEDDDSEAALAPEDASDDRRSSWLVRIFPSTWKLMSRRSETRDQASVHHHPEAEPAIEISILPATSPGFAIGLEELVQVVSGRDLQALSQYDGVGGLSTRLKTDLERGIARQEDEILQRRHTFGSNTYPCKKGKTFWGFIWKATKFPPSLIMMLAIVINSLLRIKRKTSHDGLYVEACAILATVLDITARAITEYKQSLQFEKFSEEKRNIPLEVIRGGSRLWVSTYDIVVGDIVPLEKGGQVPADGVLFVANSLKIHEQDVTGSSEIVPKDLITDPFLLSGSKVTEGIGTMLVTSVGINTEIPHETDEEKPLQTYMKWLTISTGWVVVSFASVACIVQLARYFSGWTKKSDGNTTADEATDFVIKSLNFLIVTILVTVPVGLPMAIILNHANTTRKMMTDNALVLTHTACERMGSVTTILCHKTGILTSIQDPCQPLPGTMAAIQLCRSGGVKVCMVTDDDVSTARTIAKDCGILEDSCDHNIMTGAQFRDLSDPERVQKAGKILVFAQSSPSDRLLLVKALKEGRHVFAAIGMGIHDPMTLHADVSVAMGIGEAAKENFNIIILDNFATIVKVIQWCRSLYTNIQRYVLFRFTVSVSTLAICVVEVLFYDAFPFIAVQLLSLNLFVDIFGALSLAYKPTGDHLMGKPAVGISDPLITKTMWSRLIMQVIYLVLFLVLLNSEKLLKLERGDTSNGEKVKNTFIFNSFVFCMVFSEFEIRSGNQSFKEILRENMFLVTVTSNIVIQIFVFEFLGIFVSAVNLDWKIWLQSVLVGLLSQVATRFPYQAYQYLRN